MWSSSGGLGQVQAGQYSGYLWPMGPFFALGDLAGLPEWVVQRLWLGLLLAVAAWGVVKLLDALCDARSGDVALSCTVAGALYVVNPYVTTFTQATTVTLLGYAALPWLLLAVHRGLRTPGRWWWPAVFALVLASTGGGVNAAVTGWVLLGPLLLLLYEWFTGTVGRPRRVVAHVADGRPLGSGLALVARAGGCPRGVRDQLPSLHRVGRRDLGHDEHPREPAPDGLLAELSRRWLRGRAAAVLRRQRGASLLAARRRRVAARARARDRRTRVDAALALRALLPAAPARRAARDDRRLPRGHPACGAP